jgi:hypothetical protein
MKLPRRTFLHLAAGAAALSAMPRIAEAQTELPQSKASTRLITVGTAGGPRPRADRAQSSNLLIVNNTPYIIDAGDGTTRRLAEMNFNFRSLGTIFVNMATTIIAAVSACSCPRAGFHSGRSPFMSRGRRVPIGLSRARSSISPSMRRSGSATAAVRCRSRRCSSGTTSRRVWSSKTRT